MYSKKTKICCFCNGNFTDENFELKNNKIICYPTSSWETEKFMEVNYCPICGRKLVEDDKE